MSFPRYESYKDSGVEWLGEVPELWDDLPLKAVASYNDEVLDDRTPDDYELLYVDISSVDRLTGISSKETLFFSSAPSRARRRVKHGDVIISTVRTYLRAIARIFEPEDNLIVSTGFCVVRPGERIFYGFLAYLVSSNFFVDAVISRSVGVSYPAINASDLVSIRVPLPPFPEQKTIAAFLDRETAKIDALIAEQQRLIELLKEKRQAVISHAVTKGLNPDAPMKDSGIEWLGEVPKHWGVVQSRRLFSVRNEPARESDQQLTASQKYGVIPQTEFVEREGRRVVETITGKDSLRHAESGDFIISLRSFQGGIEWCRVSGSVTFHYVILIPAKNIIGLFFSYLFKSLNYIQALRSTTNLIRDGQDMRWSHFVQVDLPVIPADEQELIAEFLDRETAKLDALTAEAQTAITLLQERRTALISAAVIGKIDVRGKFS